MGGSGLKARVAAVIVVCIWIYNVAFNIPMFMWANVYVNPWSGSAACYPRSANPVYVLAARVVNFYAPLTVTWASNIGIVYKLKHAMNKATICAISRL